MKAKKLLVRFAAAVCMLSCFSTGGIAPSEAVQIGGKSLSSIYDIVKAATGSDFPEIPKHSLLIFERHPNGSSRFRFKSSIVLINNDGSERKTFGNIVHNDFGSSPVNPSTSVIQGWTITLTACMAIRHSRATEQRPLQI